MKGERSKEGEDRDLLLLEIERMVYTPNDTPNSYAAS